MPLRRRPAAAFWLSVWFAALPALSPAAGAQAGSAPTDTGNPTQTETDSNAPTDFGLGAGVVPWRTTTGPNPAIVPQGGPSAATAGMFGAPIPWPIIAIHVVLLQDGRVMSYGTDEKGMQGAKFVYDVWNPLQGTGSDSHWVLPNTTYTDIFCSAQAVIWSTGQVLITGGDQTVGGRRHYGYNQVELFTPWTVSLTSLAPMQSVRWYPTMLPMPNGEMLVLGGRSTPTPSTPVLTPEVFNTETGWRSVPGAGPTLGLGNIAFNWYYPRAFVNTAGQVVLIGNEGTMFTLDISGNGSFTRWPTPTLPGDRTLPTLMYAPDRVLSVRQGAAAEIIDIGGPAPAVTPTGSLSQNRYWANGTVLADGRVLVNGGSMQANSLTGEADAVEIWDPATGQWSMGASAAKPRLYHSSALLLPDATVLTAGGGAPGPVRNLNAEIYYPPYLYRRDGSGLPAARPMLANLPLAAAPGALVSATVGDGQTIQAVTLVRAGTATHSTNLDQRFFNLPFLQNGAQLAVALPAGQTVLPPGHYMMFAFDSQGVPSIASMILITGQ